MALKILRGFKDVILEDALCFSNIVKVAEEVGSVNGFIKSYFPILEEQSVYQRTLGEQSDIVNKEIYSFCDKGENMVAMRPEFTAGIVRSLITNGLYDKLPLKVFSYGPLFRYERPQKCRQRQFNQINFEYFGEKSFFAEAELIFMIDNIASKLGFRDKITLEINSLGSEEARARYKDSLVEYLSKFKQDLSVDSKIRLENNPLRILDSKDPKDKEILQDSPSLKDFYNKEDAEFLNSLLEILTENNINYKINDNLVRGLDYYTGVVFEFTTNLLGSQNAVFAGGRYDSLVKNMGGKEVAGVGFGGGIERILELCAIPEKELYDVALLPMSAAEQKFTFSLLKDLREKGIKSTAIFSGQNVGKKIQKAEKMGALSIIVIGEDEVSSSKMVIKNLKTGEKTELDKEYLYKFFKKS